MNPSPANLNMLWATTLVEELVRQGVRCFTLASGARCGPLSFALAERQDIDLVVHFDERATAYFAVGHARATGKPVAWITTSGTAVANGWPAVVEASMDRIPLILMTADRPPELRATGANQTIDQLKLFGEYVRWQVDLPCPDIKIPLSMPMTTVAQACYRAIRTPGGPVHINCPFREPLAPDSDGADYRDYIRATVERGGAPYTEYREPIHTPAPATITALRNELGNAKQGLIAIGHIGCPEDQAAVREFISRVRWPVFADITSGCRFDDKPDNLIPNYDQILFSGQAEALRPDTVLHIGGRFVSRRLLEFVGRARPARYIQVKDFPDRLDPMHVVSHAVESDLAVFCANEWALPEQPALNRWRVLSSEVERVLEEFFASSGPVDEPFVSRAVSQAAGEGDALFLASSMPIRDMDMYGAAGRNLRVGANRGASGIDGTLASAAGFSSALDRRCTLIVGDLAFLHDMTSLHLLRTLKHPMSIVLINNNGGGIFSFLPAANHGAHFETCFGTPHGLTFESAAAQFNVEHVSVATRDAFRAAYGAAQSADHSTIVEVRTDRAANAERHRELKARVMRALDAL